jgi:signal transduction histidine kinase
LIEIALRNSDRLGHLINDLLDIEKIESGHMRFDPERQPLEQLIQLAIEANSGYAEGFDVALAFTPSEEDTFVYVDSYRLLQVLANLLSNAVKFAPAKSTVDVSVRKAPGSVCVSVRDRGAGIPEEFHDRIFQKFSQADGSDARNRNGTGLGLAICKAIVEQMDGRIGFHTEAGKGTTFYFELPFAPEVAVDTTSGSEIVIGEIVR